MKTKTAALDAARVDQAYKLGREVGEAAGSWVVDGNSNVDAARRALAMLRDGDPAVDDFLPRRPDLSGEFDGGGWTPQSLFAVCVGREFGGEQDEQLLEELSEAFEDGVADTFGPTCEQILIGFVEGA